MSEYIQWFVEEILNQKYIESESLKLWKIEKKSIQRNEVITNVKKVNILEKQMSIYDIL
ncbi:hypothetical protein K4T46_11640 [Staphylococcus epidermidis]|nr:hypothetical protein [Staphylococcus epidermidis]